MRTALTGLEISDRSKALNALQSKTVSESKKEEISKVIGQILMLIGVKEKFIPCEEEKEMIITFIQVNYPHKSLEEFTLAFNLAITGKLDLSTNDVKLFDIFSCEYLGRIMGAYTKWLKEVHQRQQEILSSASAKQLPANNVKLTAKQWNEMLQDSNKYTFELIPLMLYDHFTETKKLSLTAADKNNYLEKAAEYLDLYLRNSNVQQHTRFIKMNQENEFTGDIRQMLIDTSKRLIIWEQLLKKDINILLDPLIKQLNQKIKKTGNEKSAKRKP